MNAITITGNLVDAPEAVSYGSEGQSTLVNFRMGNNELVNGESTSNGFFDVTVFGKQAVNILSLKKGERIVVVGRLQHSTYERPDGTKGGRTKLIASEVGLSALFDPAIRPVKHEAGAPAPAEAPPAEDVAPF